MKYLTILMLFAISLTQAQKKPSDFFPKEKTKVLVVGTFHFDYPDLDAHKTELKDRVDVLSPQKSKEVTELVEYIKKFKPTKIAIEAWPNWNAAKKLHEYKAGKHRNERDERYQLAIRIANELNIAELESIDASSAIEDINQKFGKTDSLYFKKLTEDYDFRTDDVYQNYYTNFLKSTENPKTNLLSLLKYMNSKEFHQYEYGSYLTGDFKLREFDGADMLSLYWYNRNLRIFRNIQRIPQTKEDRILVIVGNGHASVLRQLFTSSPEYDFVEFSSL